MKAISDYMLISDIDGTLLCYGGGVPRRNVEAIRRFAAKGGRFGIATGRARSTMFKIGGDLPLGAPCVLYNGGELYDPISGKVLLEIFLPPEAPTYIQQIMHEVPEVGVVVIRGDEYYQVRRQSGNIGSFEGRYSGEMKLHTIAELPLPWYKVLFQVEAGQAEALTCALRKMAFTGVRFVASATMLVEMLPEHSSKGFALEHLITQQIVSRENLVVIGDYYNDLEMIRMAGIGATLEEAPLDIREQADLVVGSCEGGAVADIIEHLEMLCGQ